MSERKTEKQLKRAWEWIRRKMKKDHADYVKKINRTGGGPPPTPPKFDELQKIVQDIIPDLLLLPHEIFESLCVSQFLENDDDPQQNSEDYSIVDGSVEETDHCSIIEPFSSSKVDLPLYKPSPIRLQPSTQLAASSHQLPASSQQLPSSSKQLFGNDSCENYIPVSQRSSSSTPSEVEAGSSSSDNNQYRYCQTSLKLKTVQFKGRKGIKRKVERENESTKKARVEQLEFRKQLSDKVVAESEKFMHNIKSELSTTVSQITTTISKEVSQTGEGITNALGSITAVLLKLNDGIQEMNNSMQEMNNTLKEVLDKLC